jgi:hypothetical protein
MLDFYLIKDTTSKPNNGPSDLDYLGGIDYDEFEKLQDEKIIEGHLDYYKDFRWTSEQVAVKSKILEQTSAKNYKLQGILRKAKQQDCGIIAYCD